MNNKEFKSKYYDIDAYYENVASKEGKKDGEKKTLFLF
jgi:hypothetical protein